MRDYIRGCRLAFLAVLLLCVASLSAQQPGQLPTPAEGDYVIPDFHFASGEALRGLRMHYATFGTPVRDAKGQGDKCGAALTRHQRYRRTIPGTSVCGCAIWAGATTRCHALLRHSAG
jgi:hypothetical protein